MNSAATRAAQSAADAKVEPAKSARSVPRSATPVVMASERWWNASPITAVLWRFFPMIYPRAKSPHFSMTTPRRIQSVQRAGSQVSGLRNRSMAHVTISITANTRSIDTASPAIGSVFPWPYGWLASGGFWAYRTPRNTIVEPMISVALSIASAISAYEFPNIPPRNLIVASDILAMIPSIAIPSPSFGVEVFVVMRLWYTKWRESKNYTKISQSSSSSRIASTHVVVLVTIKEGSSCIKITELSIAPTDSIVNVHLIFCNPWEFLIK